jgi:uncharacterized protein YehS (DUF1456 family)
MHLYVETILVLADWQKPLGQSCSSTQLPARNSPPSPSDAKDLLVTSNDVLRRLRYIFDLSDSAMIAVFGLADCDVTREQISDWLKKDDDPAFKEMSQMQLAQFLNGLIIDRRGKKEGPQPKPERRLNNNLVFLKLKIAMNLQADDIFDIMSLAGFPLSKHEISAFFRKSDHKNYRDCKDQVLRNFLKGLELKYRPNLQSSN